MICNYLAPERGCGTTGMEPHQSFCGRRCKDCPRLWTVNAAPTARLYAPFLSSRRLFPTSYITAAPRGITMSLSLTECRKITNAMAILGDYTAAFIVPPNAYIALKTFIR